MRGEVTYDVERGLGELLATTNIKQIKVLSACRDRELTVDGTYKMAYFMGNVENEDQKPL